MEDWFIHAVGDVGFPVAIASFVIIRLNGKVGRLADAMHKLANTLEQHNQRSAEIERRLDALDWTQRIELAKQEWREHQRNAQRGISGETGGGA